MKKKVIFFVLIGILSFKFLPTLIHKLYYLKTDNKEILNNRNSYHAIANKINRNRFYDRAEEDHKHKDFLYLWFHVRGVQIDEGHDGKSKFEQWEEIINYWKL